MYPQKEILQLQFDEDISAVVMEWRGFSNSKEFRKANEQVLNLLKEKNSSRIMADLRNMRIISISEQKWLHDLWLPEAIEAGLERVAIIESEDFFNRLSVDNVVQQVNDKLTVKYFNGYLSARNWLRPE